MTNQRRQKDQARYYDRKAVHDRHTLHPNELVSVYNTINNIWEPAYIVKQTEPRTYFVNKKQSRVVSNTGTHQTAECSSTTTNASLRGQITCSTTVSTRGKRTAHDAAIACNATATASKQYKRCTTIGSAHTKWTWSTCTKPVHGLEVIWLTVTICLYILALDFHLCILFIIEEGMS